MLRNALSGQQIHALDSILPTVNTESGLKGFFTVHVGVNIQSGVSPSDKISVLESPKTEFFSKAGVNVTNERDRFLIFNRKTYKNDTLTTSEPILCCEASFKVPLPPPKKPVSDRFQLICTKLDLFTVTSPYLLGSFLKLSLFNYFITI